MTIGRRFARLVTNVVTSRPWLWRLFRAPLRWQFQRLAPRWDAMRAPGHLAALEAALEHVPTPARALDLGTGTGQAAFAIGRRFPDAEVVGVDLAPEMIRVAGGLGSGVTFRVADASSLPFEDGAFELVTLANMIPFFDELTRVVAPGGSVVFSFSSGPETPIYVPPERLREELAARGFADFAEFAEGSATALLAIRDPST